MEKIVTKGYKIDLHIHTYFSKHKDGDLVKNNTIDNISMLADKLNENQVEICALTDHDVFNYDIYKALKKYENNDNYCIKKVLPAVEFSVSFKYHNDSNVVHIIAIFNDEDDEKVKSIEKCINNNKLAYSNNKFFSEEEFLSILRDISIDTILIAHQKIL